jgi:hypothetical protein
MPDPRYDVIKVVLSPTYSLSRRLVVDECGTTRERFESEPGIVDRLVQANLLHVQRAVDDRLPRSAVREPFVDEVTQREWDPDTW